MSNTTADTGEGGTTWHSGTHEITLVLSKLFFMLLNLFIVMGCFVNYNNWPFCHLLSFDSVLSSFSHQIMNFNYPSVFFFLNSFNCFCMRTDFDKISVLLKTLLSIYDEDEKSFWYFMYVWVVNKMLKFTDETTSVVLWGPELAGLDVIADFLLQENVKTCLFYIILRSSHDLLGFYSQCEENISRNSFEGLTHFN